MPAVITMPCHSLSTHRNITKTTTTITTSLSVTSLLWGQIFASYGYSNLIQISCDHFLTSSTYQHSYHIHAHPMHPNSHNSHHSVVVAQYSCRLHSETQLLHTQLGSEVMWRLLQHTVLLTGTCCIHRRSRSPCFIAFLCTGYMGNEYAIFRLRMVNPLKCSGVRHFKSV